MATSFQPHVHHPFESPSSSFTQASRVSNSNETFEHSSSNGSSSTTFHSTSGGPWAKSSSISGDGPSALTNLVRTLPQNNNGIIGTDHESILDWIRAERMRKLPPEGSAYDKVLICARLFVERLHSFDHAVGGFAQESHMATHLAFIHCSGLLRLGEENAPALLDLFAFFYRCSVALENLLSRAELFAVSQGIKDQVILALADLVTLVVGVATHSNKHLRHTKGAPLAVDIHSTFGGPIESFRTRCEHVAELMWKHQLGKEGVDGRVAEIKSIREWLEPEDPVLTHITKFTAQFAQEREESTCLWVTPYLTRFLKGDQKALTIAGKPGSGKSILATVINDQLQHAIGGVSYMPLFVPINSRVLALATPVAIAKSILSQLFVSRIGNVGLYKALSETYERCQKTVDEEQYEDMLWDALKTALATGLKGARETVLVIDGIDEATCGQAAMLRRLKTAAGNVSNLKMVLLCSPDKQVTSEKSTVQISPGVIFDDIAAVVKRVFSHTSAYHDLPAEEEEMLVSRIVKASDGSFLWAKLAAKKVREENPSSGQALLKAVDGFLKSNQTVHDLVSNKLRSNVDADAVKVVGWLATAARPLTVGEISSLLSVNADKGAVLDRKVDPLSLLKPFASIIFYQNNMVYVRHGQIRSAIVDTYPDKSHGIKAAQVNLIRRMSLYIKHTVTGRDEPSLDPLDSHLTSSLLERHTFLDFALRYWLGTVATVYGTTEQEITHAKKELSHVFPSSPMVPLLEMTVWKSKSTPSLTLLHNLRTELYQQVLGDKHPASLQTILCQAGLYQTIEDVQPSYASQVFYTAVTICQQVLTTQHIITMRMAKHFLDFTSGHVSTSKTKIMQRRVEVLQVLVECYKIHYGTTSEVVVSTLRILAEHFTFIQEVHKAKEITVLLQGNTTETEINESRRPSEESLIVQLHGPRDVKHSTALNLDDIEQDERISSVNVDSLLREAQVSHQSLFTEAQHSETKSLTESSIVEMLTAETMDYTSITKSTTSLVQMYFTQHRWGDAAKLLKRSLHAIWPAFFASSMNDVVLPSNETKSCIALAQRLRDCYRYRRRAAKEEDICYRLYHALHRDRPVDDTMLRSITSDLVHLYERTRQTDKLVSIHRDILDDYTKRFSQTHQVVLQELWTLAELTRPQATSVEYYWRIFEISNKGSDTCKPEAFEPLIIVVTELINQERYTEVIGPARILFNSLQSNVSPKMRNPDFVRSVYDRYVYALRKTQADYHVIHDVTVQYRKTCLAVFGTSAAITISATKTLAYIAQESKQYEMEAVELFQSLLKTQSKDVDIDHEDIKATLEAISEEQAAVIQTTESVSSQHLERIMTTRVQRMSSIRETYGWAHESSLSQMEELVLLYSRRKETHAAMSLLHETAGHVLSSETSSSSMIASAKSIASSYKSIGHVQRAKELSMDIYNQVVANDTSVKSGLTIKSNTQQSLLFLAQLEYSLRDGSSVSPNEIYSSFMVEYQYFEQFRKETQSKTSTLQGVLDVVIHLQALLQSRGNSTAVSRVTEQLTDYFMAKEGQLQLQRSQAGLFLSTVLQYFKVHTSRDFVRSVALACYNRVNELLSKDSYQASDLALAAFRYVNAHDGYSHPSTMKLMFKTALALSNHVISSKTQKTPSGQQALSISGSILSPILSTCKSNSIDLSTLAPTDINTLIKVLDSQKSYKDLAWLLTSLWEKRQTPISSEANQPDGTYTLALGRMLVITRYLIGQYTPAIRLAEDILYNCARVHGPRHPSTAEMTVLLSQMYTSVAQGYQDKPTHRELASQYYRKAAGLHENALRVFIDPSSADAIDEPSPPSSPLAPSSPTSPSNTEIGKSVKQHLHLLKLAVERLGSWPKEYTEYEHLSEDLFKMFAQDLKGEKGVEKWDLKHFGGGKAEGDDDLVPEGGFVAIAV